MQGRACQQKSYDYVHANMCALIVVAARGDGNTVVPKCFSLGKSILFIFIKMTLLSE